jgi:putative oxidoreductase
LATRYDSKETATMFTPISSRYLPATQAALRIMAGLAYFSHGAMKSFGWFGGETVELISRWGVAGVIEVLMGTLLVLGLATRLAAFIASGEMAVAYLWIHTGGSGYLAWWQNGGETALLFCFIWLVFAAWGAGPLSMDRWRAAADGPA